MKHFLLTGEPWIPVVRKGGGFADVSLLELFEEGDQIVDLAVPPAQRVALMRLLLCIVARSLPLPRERREWESAAAMIAPRAIAYLKQWKSAFDLYGERPFLQAVGLKTINATLDKLDFTLASGSNHTLFDHAAAGPERQHSPAWQARMLLVTQNFSPGGTVGANFWNNVKTNNLSGNISSPALEGSPLHTFLLGENILESLHLNLIPQEELGEMEIGIPVWEAPPRDARDAQRFRATLLGRLAPISRAITLPEEGSAIPLAVGCNYAQIAEFIDPYLANRRLEKEQTLAYVRIQADRHPWRELEALLELQPNRSAAKMPPKHLLNRNWIPPEKEVHLWCGGVSVDKAKYIFSGEWLLTFQEKLLTQDEFWSAFGHFVQAAEECAVLMKNAIGFFWSNLSKISSGDSGIQVRGGREYAVSQALTGYWQRLDMRVPGFIASAEGAGDFPSLYRELRKIVESFFSGALPDQFPRGLQARAMTMPYFRKELNRILANNEEKGEKEDGI